MLVLFAFWIGEGTPDSKVEGFSTNNLNGINKLPNIPDLFGNEWDKLVVEFGQELELVRPKLQNKNYVECRLKPISKFHGHFPFEYVSLPTKGYLENSWFAKLT